MTDRRLDDLSRWGFEVTATFPSGRVHIKHPNGTITKCASLNKAYNAIVEWRKRGEK